MNFPKMRSALAMLSSLGLLVVASNLAGGASVAVWTGTSWATGAPSPFVFETITCER